MKTATNTIIATIASILLIGFSACEKKEEGDLTPPGVVTNVEIEPLNGGAKISYELPSDNDILFVKASYTNSLGTNVFKVSSFYDNIIEIDGFNDTNEHEIKLEVIDRSNNASQPVYKSFTPLKSHIQLVQESMVLTPDFGGIRLEWENPAAKTVFTYFTYADTNGNEITRILPSSKMFEKMVVRGMDTTSTECFVQVEDFYGNKTENISKGSYSPLFEQKIDKTKWTLLSNLSVEGDAWEGLTVNLWDDVIDTKESQDDNSYCMNLA